MAPSPMMMLSRSHALIEPADSHGSVLVTDLRSVNGTAIVDIDGTEERLPTDQRVHVPVGSALLLAGELLIEIVAARGY
jgi:hypothetical protein